MQNGAFTHYLISNPDIMNQIFIESKLYTDFENKYKCT